MPFYLQKVCLLWRCWMFASGPERGLWVQTDRTWAEFPAGMFVHGKASHRGLIRERFRYSLLLDTQYEHNIPKHCDYLHSNELAVNQTFARQTSSNHYLFVLFLSFHRLAVMGRKKNWSASLVRIFYPRILFCGGLKWFKVFTVLVYCKLLKKIKFGEFYIKKPALAFFLSP